MAMSGSVLGGEIKTAIDGASSHVDRTVLFNAMGGAITAHVMSNAHITAAGFVSGGTDAGSSCVATGTVSSLDGNTLGGLIRTQIDGVVNKTDRPSLFLAMGSAIVYHITNAGSVSAFGTLTSGPDSGTPIAPSGPITSLSSSSLGSAIQTGIDGTTPKTDRSALFIALASATVSHITSNAVCTLHAPVGGGTASLTGTIS